MKSHKLVKDWGKVHEKGIDCLYMTPDGEYLITGDGHGVVKQHRIKSQE